MNKDVKLIWEAYKPSPEQVMDDLMAGLSPLAGGQTGGVVHFKNGFSWEYSLTGGAPENLKVTYELKDPDKNIVQSNTYTQYKPKNDPKTFNPKEHAINALQYYHKQQRSEKKRTSFKELEKIFREDEWHENWIEAEIEGYDIMKTADGYGIWEIGEVDNGDSFYGVLDSPAFNMRFYIKGKFNLEPGERATYDSPGEDPRYYFEIDEIKSSHPLPPDVRKTFRDLHDIEIEWEYKHPASAEDIEKAVGYEISEWMTEYLNDTFEDHVPEYDPY